MKRVVRFGANKAKFRKKCTQPMKPSPPMKPSMKCLFKPIYRLMVVTHMMWVAIITNSSWLSHMYLLCQLTMEKSTVHIKLTNGPPL